MSPEERAQARARWQAMRAGAGGNEGFRGAPRSGGPGGEGVPQIVWKLLPNNTLRPVRVKTGVTDFTLTALVEGDLQPGDKLVIGQTSSGRPGASPVGGIPRRF
jgi:hypothetical protein